MKRNN